MRAATTSVAMVMRAAMTSAAMVMRGAMTSTSMTTAAMVMRAAMVMKAAMTHGNGCCSSNDNHINDKRSNDYESSNGDVPMVTRVPAE